MKRKVWKGIALTVLSAMLIAVSGLVGCGGEAAGEEIVIGFLCDFTGPGSFAIKPTVESIQDYFKVQEEEGTFGDVRITFATYDTKLDYGRVGPGYESLKAKGTVMMYVVNPAEAAIIASKAAEDQMPIMTSAVTPEQEPNEWIFNTFSSTGTEVEAVLQYVMDTWDYDTNGVPKIGHLGWTLETTDHHQEGIDSILAEYPDKFEFVGIQRAPVSTSTWAGEVEKLRNSDYILISAVGSMMATFIREARDRDYEGGFLSGINAFPGYWPTARDVVPAANLYECYYAGMWPWYNEDVPFITNLKSAIETYRAADAADRLRNSGPITGWMQGWIIADAVKRAIDEYGLENVDSATMKEALEATNLDVQGFGNTWNLDKGPFFVWTKKVFKWSTTALDWEAVSGWITPVSLAD